MTMPQNAARTRHAPTRPDRTAPWVIDTRELGRRPGSMREYHRDFPAPTTLGVEEVISVPRDAPVALAVRLESVMEGVLASGTVTAPVAGECSRCLAALDDEVRVELTELFAYPDSATDESTDEDEVSRVVEDMVDLEPAVRDAVILALPPAPLCREDCPGLCAECGGRRADLEAGHAHETIDPRWAALKQRFGGAEEENQ